jgi:hypothetical protein
MRKRQRDDGREKQRWDPARACDAVGSGMPDTVKGGSRPWSQTLVDAPDILRSPRSMLQGSNRVYLNAV